MKKFWKRTEGFTLVELIVVIAILGILAGVGTVGYSGYVKKANMAADQQLLAALNQAFAVACIENGVNTTDGDLNAAMTLDEGTISEEDDSLDVTHAKETDIVDAFWKYFAGNENAEFKVIKKLIFKDGVFKEASLLAGIVNEILNNSDYADEIAAIKASALGKAGATNLANQYDTISTHVGSLITAGIEKMFGGNDISSNTFASLVLNPEYAAKYGIDEEAFTEMLTSDPEGTAKFFANSLVIGAAQGAADKDATYVTGLISDTSVAQLKEDLKGSDSEKAQAALTNTALIYGVYTSYLYATKTEDEAATELAGLKTSKNLEAALEVMNKDANFAAYIKGEGQSDIDAYLKTLKLIDEATSDEEVRNEVLKNGFADDQMMELLTGLLGK